MSSFTIDSKIFDIFPNLAVGHFKVHNLKRVVSKINLETLHNEMISVLEEKNLDPALLSQDPNISSWRKAYSLMGVKPSKYLSSVEALTKRVLKNGAFSTGIPSVDIYNAVSIKNLAPLGAYDLNKLEDKEITFRFINPEQDNFTPLGGSASSFPLTNQLVSYATDKDILCWGFNHRDSYDYCLDENTDSAWFFSEAVTEQQYSSMKAVLEDLRLIFELSGAQVEPIHSFNVSSKTNIK